MGVFDSKFKKFHDSIIKNRSIWVLINWIRSAYASPPLNSKTCCSEMTIPNLPSLHASTSLAAVGGEGQGEVERNLIYNCCDTMTPIYLTYNYKFRLSAKLNIELGVDFCKTFL